MRSGAAGTAFALVHELRPPSLDELGLAAAVRQLADRLSGSDTGPSAGAGPS